MINEVQMVPSQLIISLKFAEKEARASSASVLGDSAIHTISGLGNAIEKWLYFHFKNNFNFKKI